MIEALTGETNNNDGVGTSDSTCDGECSEQRDSRRVKIDAVIDIQTLAGLVDAHNKQWTLEELRSGTSL